ncbi:MAG: hypothetical protein L0I62_04535 [Gammaproteobacteria bacterium]|nr:hypothetical protein [Gammaproteobacteria bacterium]
MRCLQIAFILILVMGVAVLAACSPTNPSTTGPRATTAGAVVPATAVQSEASYDNVFAYCRAVGTIDRPDARYTGANPPPAVIAGLIEAFHAPPSASRTQVFTLSTSWRCMDGHVYACTVGANLPCQAQANTRRTPTEAENEYCAANPDAGFIPMSVTGHNTVYDWRCEGAKAVAGKQLSEVDERGYIADIWYRIPAPASAPTPVSAH